MKFLFAATSAFSLGMALSGSGDFVDIFIPVFVGVAGFCAFLDTVISDAMRSLKGRVS
jgi:hypothetical protein